MEHLSRLLAEGRILPDLIDLLGEDESCHLVGGALRDHLLERTVSDFDFATPGDPTPLARRFAVRVGGKWFVLDRERAQSRVVAGGRTYDFAPFRAPDLPGDLRLRDFTVNALALRLTCEGPASEIFDPLGGRLDLAHGRLRACSVGVFDDDPLRVLKGVRHAADLGFRLEAQTLTAMQAAVGLLGRIAPERVRSEVAAIFAAPCAAGALKSLHDLGIERRLFGAAGEGGSFNRGRALAERTEKVLHLLAKQARPAAEVEGGLTRMALLKFAAFLRGSGRCDPLLVAGRLRLGRRATATLAALLALEASANAAIPTLPDVPRARALWADGLGPSPRDALVFLAALSAESPSDSAALVRPLFDDLDVCSSQGRIPDLVDGREVRERLALPEGPEVGVALSLLRRAEVTGLVRTVAEAEKFLISLDKKMIDNEMSGTL